MSCLESHERKTGVSACLRVEVPVHDKAVDRPDRLDEGLRAAVLMYVLTLVDDEPSSVRKVVHPVCEPLYRPVLHDGFLDETVNEWRDVVKQPLPLSFSSDGLGRVAPSETHSEPNEV